MRQLNAKTEEENKFNWAQNFIRILYTGAVEVAKYTVATTYYYSIPTEDPTYINNMPIVLAGLEKLFPNCSVSHTILARGDDGKLYDIAKIDDLNVKLVHSALPKSYIVIDWT